MNPIPAATLRRLVIVARAPSLTAPQLAQLASADPDLAALGCRDRREFARLGLTTRTADWLARQSQARVLAVPIDVGPEVHVRDYFALIDLLLKQLLDAERDR